ncbi:MAG: hypothetical protein K1X53_02905 [Candidatus Sumerlaeaceae bacterium]|nr:hypothetical protein [Candidatus Sumerlaeaceae bacterium]
MSHKHAIIAAVLCVSGLIQGTATADNAANPAAVRPVPRRGIDQLKERNWAGADSQTTDPAVLERRERMKKFFEERRMATTGTLTLEQQQRAFRNQPFPQRTRPVSAADRQTTGNRRRVLESKSAMTSAPIEIKP